MKKNKSGEYNLLDSMYIRFKYRQNYVLCYLSMQTNMAKININKQNNLKIQDSGVLWGEGKGMELGKGTQKAFQNVGN